MLCVIVICEAAAVVVVESFGFSSYNGQVKEEN